MITVHKASKRKALCGKKNTWYDAISTRIEKVNCPKCLEMHKEFCPREIDAVSTACETIQPKPYIRPNLNMSDVILIRTALELVKEDLIPELQLRADLIIQEILEAEKRSKLIND